MIFNFKKQFIIICFSFVLCFLVVVFSYNVFGKKSVAVSNESNDEVIIEPTTSYYVQNDLPIYEESVMDISEDADDSEIFEPAVVSKIPYAVAPPILDDGSIVFDGLTLTELTNKLNKSLKSYVTNTGYFIAKYTKTYGLDPYLATAILLHETGCAGSNGCSRLAVNCNNFGGLTGGSKKCSSGGRFNKYDTIEEGLNAYLNILYNRYYSKGKDTPEEMAYEYADGSETWAGYIRSYYNSIKNK